MGEYHIGVFGAGVVGLHTCLELQRLLRNAQITVIADKFNRETTSDGAAGFFEPATYFSGPTEEITDAWIKGSFDFYKTLLDQPMTGVKEISGYSLSKLSYEATRNCLMEKLVKLNEVDEGELHDICPGDWKWGSYFTSLLIECRLFLPWAIERFLSNGGAIIPGKLDSFSNASKFGKFDVIVNCTGLGAKKLCEDRHIVPVRGQVYKVDAPWLKHFYFGDDDTYIIPGITAATLGGTKNLGSWNRDIDKYDSKSIMERCTRIVPRLVSVPVIREWVGLRPYRPVVRVQPEIINGIKVVHNYGHGGSGVTSSPGTAQAAAQHVIDLLKFTSAKY